MTDLIEHLVRPLLSYPDDLQISLTEGESMVLIEMSINPEDIDVIRGQNNERLQAIRYLLSAAGGPLKPTLELIEAGVGAAPQVDAEIATGE